MEFSGSAASAEVTAIDDVDKRKKANHRMKQQARFTDPGVRIISIGETKDRLAL